MDDVDGEGGGCGGDGSLYGSLYGVLGLEDTRQDQALFKLESCGNLNIANLELFWEIM